MPLHGVENLFIVKSKTKVSFHIALINKCLSGPKAAKVADIMKTAYTIDPRFSCVQTLRFPDLAPNDVVVSSE